jgi:uncharacterized protein (DUF58 family)
MTAIPYASASSVRRLSLVVTRRLDGRLHGDHDGRLSGPGSEPADARQYVVGDDVRRIDWAATARSGGTVVRDTIAERELQTTLVLDLSASMAFGTSRCEKRDLAVAVAAAFGHLASGPGDRLGTHLLGVTGVRRLPARGGRAAAQALARAAAAVPREGGSGPDLTSVLTALSRHPAQRGLVVVISDLVGPPELEALPWARPLSVLSRRHDTLVVEIVDPRELTLPDVGALRVVDPETGRQLEVHTTPALRRRYAEAARERRHRSATAVRASGSGHVVLRTDRDWLPELARFLSTRRRLRAAGSASRRGTA